jgi:hypothetical protein
LDIALAAISSPFDRWGKVVTVSQISEMKNEK